MGEAIVTVLAIAALIGGCALVALVTTAALRGVLGRTPLALGASALLMSGLFALVGGGGASVLVVVGLAHAIAGVLLWSRARKGAR